jgi:hypothetical protein
MAPDTERRLDIELLRLGLDGQPGNKADWVLVGRSSLWFPDCAWLRLVG